MVRIPLLCFREEEAGLVLGWLFPLAGAVLSGASFPISVIKDETICSSSGSCTFPGFWAVGCADCSACTASLTLPTFRSCLCGNRLDPAARAVPARVFYLALLAEPPPACACTCCSQQQVGVEEDPGLWDAAAL